MRSLSRTIATDALVRDALALSAAAWVVGVSFGAIAVSSGVTSAQTVAMSVFVFAGGAQFLAVGVIGAGGTAVAAVLGGLLLNARHLPFGLAVADALGTRRVGLLLGSHVLTDETVAFALAREDPAARRRAYRWAGAGLFIAWNIGTVVGIAAGRAVGDPAAFGIDAAFPAGLLALVLPSLREAAALRVGLGAAAVALGTAWLLPAGLPVLAALVALVLVGRP